MDSTRVRHVLVRHEQGAGHAATGYAQATGKVGVCMATSGPGATNLVTPIADAHMDSVPLVAITGQVASKAIGTDAFQEADIVGITMPITKHNFLVTKAEDIPRVIAQAFHIASTGRPGPVLVDIAKDALQAQTTFSWPPVMDLPGYRPVTKPHAKQIREAAKLITTAKRPVLYVGGGVLKAQATAELKVLAELTGAPVTTTLMALGAFPDSHPLHVGMPGMHGAVTAVTALQKADLIVALGARFDDRVTGKLDSFAPYAKIVHADIDPAEIGKNRAADVPIVGDAREVIADLVQAVQKEHSEGHQGDYTAWWKDLSRWRETYPLGYDQPDGRLALAAAGHRAHRPTRPGGHDLRGGRGPAPDVGRALHPVREARDLAQLRRRRNDGLRGPGRDGRQGRSPGPDGLGDRRRRLLPDDQSGTHHLRPEQHPDQGRHHQQRRPRDGPPVADPLLQPALLQHRAALRPGRDGKEPSAGTRVPDFVKLSEAMGCYAIRCESPDDLDKVIEEANSINDRPVVVDFIVHEDAMVWPMVAAGTSNDEIMAARDVRPDFGDNEDD